MTTIQAPNSSARLFQNLNKICFLIGLPNVWIYNVDLPDYVKKFFGFYRRISLVFIAIFIFCEIIAVYTQQNLTEKQRGDLVMFSMSHPLLILWIIVTECRRNRIKNLLYQLTIVLKEIHNDKQVEEQMVKKAMRSSAAYSALFMMALISYGYTGLMEVLRGEGTFTTVITVWPDVNDTSFLAGVARVFCYLIWWVFMSRSCGVYVTIISVLVCLSHQFKNLQSYFHSLNEIWEADLEQREKEEKYEAAFKVGVQMHSQTLWCTKECQAAYDVLFTCQTFMVVSVLVMLMSQMVHSDRTLGNIMTIAMTTCAILISTGFFMWNAGDVTIEAAEMTTAMYCSGWQHCRFSAGRMRRLMIITMTQSQRPVILWALGIVEMSYTSYVSIVKSSYSVFSVIY